jgi:hypothetical protein
MQKTYFFAYIICGFYSFLTMNLAGKDMSIREIEIVRTKKGNSLLLPHIVISIIILIPHQFPKHFSTLSAFGSNSASRMEFNGMAGVSTEPTIFIGASNASKTILLYTSR